MSDLAILTKKKIVTFQEEDGESKSITLYPFGFQYFNDAIEIINKYFACYNSVKAEYLELKNQIVNQDLEEDKLYKMLAALNNDFDEVGKIVQNILSSTDSKLGNDIAAMIGFCCREEIDLNQFHWGEVGALLAASIEVNMDFFAQNKSKITLLKEVKKEDKKSPKTGESKSVD